jgi:hypothetical protein
MTFLMHVSVPVKDSDGWEGANHWPTLILAASTEEDAKSKRNDILNDLPKGSSAILEAF